MSWFLIVFLCFLYLVLGGAVHKLIEKTELDKESEFLASLPPIIMVIFWPFFVVVGLFLFVFIGAAWVGETLMEQIIKFFSSNEKKEDENK